MSNSISNKQRISITKSIFYALGYSANKTKVLKQLKDNPKYRRIGRRQLAVLVGKRGEGHVRRFEESRKNLGSTP